MFVSAWSYIEYESYTMSMGDSGMSSYHVIYILSLKSFDPNQPSPSNSQVHACISTIYWLNSSYTATGWKTPAFFMITDNTHHTNTPIMLAQHPNTVRNSQRSYEHISQNTKSYSSFVTLLYQYIQYIVRESILVLSYSF